MRIIEICPFSAGICGVWARVQSESAEFIKNGHTVLVLSSDVEKGTGARVSLDEESISGIKVKRFPSRNNSIDNLISDNVHHWFSKEVEQEIIAFNPDIIITHLLHPHSSSVSKLIPLLKRNNANLKVFIVPHAPFNVKRKFPLNIITWAWRHTSKINLNAFDALIAITQWELPFLKKFNIIDKKIVYIPNGISSAYFGKPQRKSKIKGDVLFLGRIAPVKNLELLVNVAKELPKVNFSIVGAAEPNYLNKIKNLSKDVPNLFLYPPIYNLSEKISLLDNHKIFVLPSHREAMPQVLIEAMARGLIVISSNTDGGKEIISDKFNGFIFDKSNQNELKELILNNINGNRKISSNAIATSKKYLWPNLIKIYESLF